MLENLKGSRFLSILVTDLLYLITNLYVLDVLRYKHIEE